MANEVSNQLVSMQTGQYQPSQDEKERLRMLTGMKNVSYSSLSPGDYRTLVSNPILSTENSSLGEEAARAGWGQSRYDTGTFEPGMDLEDARARAQSGGAKILNGALKGGVTAATTAVETVAGVIDGLLEGTGELTRQALFGEELDVSKAVGRGVNNYVARTMAHIQELSEEWFPNYRTQYERSDKYQDEWLKHIFSANFIGDSFLKNFGFTVGALAGGAAWSNILSRTLKAATASDLLKSVVAAAEGNTEAKAAVENVLQLVERGAIKTITDDPAIAKLIGNAAKNLNKMSTKHQLFGGVISAMGEGTFEGVMARNEFLDNRLKNIDAEFAEAYRNLEQEIANNLRGTDMVNTVTTMNPDGTVTKRYVLNEGGQKILDAKRQELARQHMLEREAAMDFGDRVAATTFMWNLPILTVSNTMQFGRMLSGGWKTTRNVAKTAGDIAMQEGKLIGNVAAKGAAKGAVFGNTVLGTVKRGITEASEEMAQGFVSSGAKRAADTKLTAFNDDGFDRESLDKIGKWVGVSLDGGMEYLKEGRNWQEGFLGMITGIVGIPGRQWNGGFAEAYREAKGKVENSREAANALNTLVNSDRFQRAVKGWVRHQKYESEMEDGVKSDDKYSWKTANDKQLINDIITFANAGRLQDLYDIVDYYANMSDDDSNGLEVVDAATSDQNATEVKNNPQKIVANVKEQAQTIKENIKMYNDMYDAMDAMAPMGTSRDQIEEMIAASMNIKAFEKRFLSVFNDLITGIEPQVKALSLRDDDGKFAKKQERLDKAKQIYTTLAETMTNVSIPFDPNTIEELDVIPVLSQLRDEINKSGNQELKDKYEDLKKLAADRKAFVNKLLTLQNIDPAEYESQKKTADTVNNEMKKEEAEDEVASMNSLALVKNGYEQARKKGVDEASGFVERMKRAKDKNHNVSAFLDIFDAYSNLRRAYMRQSGTMTSLEESIVNEVFKKAVDKSDMTDISRIETYEERMTREQNEVASAPNFDVGLKIRMGQLDVSKDTYDAAVQKVSAAMQSLSNIQQSTAGRTTTDPVANPSTNVAQGEGNEPASAASKAKDPTKKKTATLNQDMKSAVDAAGRTWTIGEKMFCYDETNPRSVAEEFTIKSFRAGDKGDVRAELEGPRQMSVSLKNQVPFIHKEPRKQIENQGTVFEERVVTPTKEQVLDDAVIPAPPVSRAQRNAESGTNTYSQKTYYNVAIPEFESESSKAYFEIKDSDGSREEVAAKRKSAIMNLVDFLTPRKNDRLIQKLFAENAWTNAVKQVKVGDKVQFIALDGYTDNGKPIIFMAVEKDGQRYIFNVMRRNGEEVNRRAGLKDFIDAFDDERAKHPNGEFVFSKQATVWGKRDGIIDYAYTDDFSGERPITKDGNPDIEGYDENAPIVWINGNAEFETLRGNPTAAQSIYTWRNMPFEERRKHLGNLYYLADDGNGGYKPIRLGIEHFSTRNYMSDDPAFAAVRHSLSTIEGITGRFFNRISKATSDEEKQRILAEENEALHKEVAEGLRKYVDLTHGFFTFLFNREGEPRLRYDRNSASKKEGDFDGFYLTHENYNKLIERFAEEHVSFDFLPRRDLDKFLKKGYITSNAKKLLPKQVDVYITHWENGDFVPTLEQQEALKEVTETNPPTVEDEVAATTEEPVTGPETAPITAPDIDFMMGGGFESVMDFDEEEFGGSEQAGPAEPAPEVAAKTPWDFVDKKKQEAVIKHYGERIIAYYNSDTTSPEDRQDILDCVFVG